jgi:hypothetical protein
VLPVTERVELAETARPQRSQAQALEIEPPADDDVLSGG